VAGAQVAAGSLVPPGPTALARPFSSSTSGGSP